METTTEEKMSPGEAMMRASTMVRAERLEQVEKHKFIPEHDDKYTGGELAQASRFCTTLIGWPHGWRVETMNRIAMKPYKERLVIAAAFMQAELERVLRAGGK